MFTYKLGMFDNLLNRTSCINRSDGWSIPLAPDNTDYANFKKEILADEAQLQDADGNTMTPEEAQAYIKELP
jgi:hypothetical protein